MTTVSEIQEEFDQAVEIRKELNSVHWKDYEKLATVFAAVFNEPKRALKFISDLNYYTGGYPSETSPPRINALLERIGTAARYFSLIGRLDELNMVLEPYGFKLEPTKDTVVMDWSRVGEDKKATKAFEALGLAESEFGETPEEVVNEFLNRTHSLQRTICTMADEIKIDLFELANTKLPEIGKSGFVTAVNSVANKQLRVEKKRDPNGIVEKALEKSETLRADADLLEEAIRAES